MRGRRRWRKGGKGRRARERRNQEGNETEESGLLDRKNTIEQATSWEVRLDTSMHRLS